MLISIIVAMSSNRVIGVDGQLPWQLPADLQRFKQLTMGHTLLMGRKTFASIGRPLPGRTSFLLSRTPGFTAPGCQVFTEIQAAIDAAAAAGESELFICGGEEVYRQALPLCQRIYLTELEQQLAGDRYFPEIPAGQFRRVAHQRCFETQNYSFSTFERLPDAS